LMTPSSEKRREGSTPPVYTGGIFFDSSRGVGL
jgi:hypothetical protein